MELPEPIATAVKPLLLHLPLAESMPALVPAKPRDLETLQLVEVIIARHAEVAASPPLCAGLWLYVDELEKSHAISQKIENSTGSFWHAIMHRREGDFDNSHYWYRRTGHHPAMDLIPGFEAYGFLDEVAAYYRDNPEPLVARQRLEWSALFKWCADEAVQQFNSAQ